MLHVSCGSLVSSLETMVMVMVILLSLCMCTLVQLLAVQQSLAYTSGILCQTVSQPSSLAHPVSELSTRKYLDKYLASAFNLAREDGRLKVVDSQQYVLTLDYTLKVDMTAHQLVHGKGCIHLVLSTAILWEELQCVASTRSQLYMHIRYLTQVTYVCMRNCQVDFPQNTVQYNGDFQQPTVERSKASRGLPRCRSHVHLRMFLSRTAHKSFRMIAYVAMNSLC